MAIFLTVVLAVLGGFHAYLWARLVRDPAWPAPFSAILTGLVIAALILLPFGMIGGRFLPRSIGEWVAFGAFLWMGAGFYLLLSLFAGELLKLVLDAGLHLQARLSPAELPFDGSRRELLARGVAAGAVVATTGVTGFAVRRAISDVQVREVEVKLHKLPRALSGLTIAQLTDIHVGPTIDRRFLQRLVEQTNAVKPDLVAITGDLVDGTVERLGEHVAPLAGLRARYGSFFVTGNHEYYSGADEWLAFLRTLGLRTLRNERVELGDAGGAIDLCGVDDWTAAQFGPGHGHDVARAVAGRDVERAAVLLAHQPRSVVPAGEVGVDLVLSGHTHGGQIWPFGGVVRLIQPYVQGLHRHADATQIYVSPGTGYWGPPMRVGTEAEITKLVLVPA